MAECGRLLMLQVGFWFLVFIKGTLITLPSIPPLDPSGSLAETLL